MVFSRVEFRMSVRKRESVLSGLGRGAQPGSWDGEFVFASGLCNEHTCETLTQRRAAVYSDCHWCGAKGTRRNGSDSELKLVYSRIHRDFGEVIDRQLA